MQNPILIGIHQDTPAGVPEASAVAFRERVDPDQFPAVDRLPERRAARVAGTNDRLDVVAKAASRQPGGARRVKVIAENFRTS